jgi:hypothetical protein
MQWLEGFGEERGVREAALDQVALLLARGARDAL